MAFCDARQFDEARTTTLRVLEFNPDLPAAKKALQALNRTPRLVQNDLARPFRAGRRQDLVVLIF